jgi:hypothetical protein
MFGIKRREFISLLGGAAVASSARGAHNSLEKSTALDYSPMAW